MRHLGRFAFGRPPIGGTSSARTRRAEDPPAALRAALTDLITTVLDDLAQRDGTPTIGPMPDLRHWQRYSQTSFVALRRAAWHMPERVSTIGWLDTFTEMVDVRKVIDADPLIGSRVDTLVGTEFSRQYRRLDWLLVEHLLEPIVLATRAFLFDQTAFDIYYARLEAGLLADEIRMVEFLPLNAFTSPFEEVELPDGLVLRPMTDRQMSAAIRVQGVPGELGGGPNAFEVSWLNQWALVTERAFPVCSEKQGMPEQPAPPPFPSLEEPANRLIQALRIACGGSVIATRPIHAQHDDDFPADLGDSAALPAVGTADLDRPTRLLSSEDADAVREVYRLVGDPAVHDNRALRTAMRRLVFSGSRNLVQDRLVDLMTSAEALFIKRAGVKSRDKGIRIAEGASTLLGEDPVLGADSDAITEFMRLAYRLRNDEIHGDDPARRTLTRLDGSEAGNLGVVVEDIERVMRRTTHLVLRDVAGSQTPGQR